MSWRPEIDVNLVEDAIRDARMGIHEQIRKKGPGILVSGCEILGVIAEEYHELVEANQTNDGEVLRKELLDLAVGALFGIASIDSWKGD